MFSKLIVNKLVLGTGTEILKTFFIRYSHTSHVVDNKLIVVGGVNPYHQDDCHVIVISLTDWVWKGFLLPVRFSFLADVMSKQ